MIMYDLFCGYGGASRPFVDAGWDEEAGPRFWMVENVRGSYRAISALLGVPLTKGGYNNNAYWLWGNVDLLMPHCRKSLRSSDVRERARGSYAIGDAVKRAIEVA